MDYWTVCRRSVVAENTLVVLKQCLNCHTLGLHVAKLALELHGSHDGWCEDHGKVERSHLRVR